MEIKTGKNQSKKGFEAIISLFIKSKILIIYLLK